MRATKKLRMFVYLTISSGSLTRTTMKTPTVASSTQPDTIHARFEVHRQFISGPPPTVHHAGQPAHERSERCLKPVDQSGKTYLPVIKL
jgi:hypothetical protein